MFYIGIDVGFAGSICVLNDKSELEYICEMPLKDNSGAMKHDYDEKAIIEILNNYYPNNIALEYQHTRPGQGAVTQSRQLYGFGLLKGIASVITKNNLHIVDPITWQNYFNKKYLSVEQLSCFKGKKQIINIDEQYFKETIIDYIKDDKFKTWYEKWSYNKTTSLSKARAAFIYYIINKNNINSINYKNNNLIDSFLLSLYCFNIKK